MDTSIAGSVYAELFSQALNLSLLILSMVTTIAARAAIKWLEERQKKEGEDYVNSLGQRIVKAVEVAVTANMGTVVADLKAASSDGKITKDEAIKILDDTVARVLSYLGDGAVKDLEAIMQPDKLREFVKEAIEAKIVELKKGQGQ